VQHQVVFGDSWITADLPDDIHLVPPGVSASLEGVTDLNAAVRSALDDPLDLPPLKEFARGRSKVIIAFDDPTVPCYAPVWPVALQEIIADLYSAGVDKKNIQLCCANALHRKFTTEELAKLIGDDIVAEFAGQLDCHDAEDAGGIVEIGTTRSGYVVELNKLVAESDLVIYLNASTTRGFSGGWKSICVGLSSYRSIQHHHTPDLMSMSMERNRMHEVLDEMGALTEGVLGRERFFKLETVLANPIQVARIFCGSVGATRRAALELNRSSMSNRRDLLEEKADIVAYGVPDWSPYAAYSFTNPILTLISTGLGYLGGMIEAIGKPGCTVVLATPCPNRWDEQHHPSYKEVWERVIPETKDPFEARSRFESEFASDAGYVEKYRNNFGFHGCHGIMALYPLKRLRHAGRVIVAGAEDPSIVEHVGFTPTNSLEDAIAEARGEHGPTSSVALVEYPTALNRS
jgi:hypothetical protein